MYKNGLAESKIFLYHANIAELFIWIKF